MRRRWPENAEMTMEDGPLPTGGTPVLLRGNGNKKAVLTGGKSFRLRWNRAVALLPFMSNLIHRMKSAAGRCLVLAAGPALLSLGDNLNAGPAPVDVTNAWTFTFGHPNSTVNYSTSAATPAIGADGTIYIGSFDGTFFALTPEGKVKWKYRAGREVQSSAAIGTDGTIYFGARDRKFYALTPDGKLKWTFATGGWVDSSPAIAADGTLYFGCWDGFFYALNPDGTLRWKFNAGGIVDSSPAVAADGTIYFGSHDKKFYALAPDGKLRWSFPTGGQIISSPAIGPDGAVYFSSLDGNLYALNPDGTQRWRTRTGCCEDGSPVLDEAGNIYVSGRNADVLPGHYGCGHFVRLTAEGRQLWTWGGYHEPMVAAAVAKGQIYLSRPMNEFHAGSPDRQLLWKTQLMGDLTSAPVISDEGTIFFSARQYLYAIHPPSPAPPANSSWPMFRGNSRHTGRVAKN
jgi:outer membrane protein assembly factor BamB